MKRLLLPLLFLLIAAAPAHAQLKATFSFETDDATQFGYDALSKGAVLGVSYRRGAWEPLATFSISDLHKAYIGEGNHLSAVIGTRYFLSDSGYFVIVGASVNRDANPQYVKYAWRGYGGGGKEIGGVRVTLTAFGPPDGLASDPNTVKGITALVEYEKAISGPISLYTAAQGSVNSFNPTGGSPEDRFTGTIWKARGGVVVRF